MCTNVSKEKACSYILSDRSSWIFKQQELLEKERQAEVDAAVIQVEDISLKQLEAKGVAISKLLVTEISTGLFGRPTVTLAPRHQQGNPGVLPSHTFSSGDIVGVWSTDGGNNNQIASGVLVKIAASSIQIALDDESPELEQIPDDGLVRIHKLANDVTYKRIKKGLEELEKLTGGCSGHLIGVLFRETIPYDPLPDVPEKLLNSSRELDLNNKRLDESQVSAVKFALRRKDLTVVHGPPGTGKTTTLVEIILQHVKLGCKVLAVAPSNLAVDNLLERLVESKASVLRVGHPARATPRAQQRSLDALIQRSDEFQLIQDIHKDIKACLASLSKTKEKGKRFKLKEEIKNFRKELKQREMRLSKDLLMRSDVVLTTLVSAGNSGPLKLLNQDHFDLTVIDECSQGLECACYLAAMKSPKLLIAGDHQQLPPTIISTEAAKEGFLVSLMERIIDMYSNEVTIMLKTQYRMNSSIMSWASEALYDSQLKAHSSVESHLLCQMKDVCSNEDTENALVLIDTAGCNYEEVSGDDLSKGNEGEAAIVSEQVKRLISSGVRESDVAVISPYNLQVDMVRTLLREIHPGVEVRSVDGFQGREKEAVVITLVRSNKQGEIGFLSEDRRLNVAVTRARRQLTLVCDTDTVCRHPFIKTLVDHISMHGLVKSGHEYESDFDVQSQVSSFKIKPLETITKSKKKDDKREKTKSKKDEEKEKERNEERRIEFESKIEDFVKNEEIRVLEFPKNLNSFERLLVHEVADRRGLIHESQGEGKDRFIILRKKEIVSEKEQNKCEGKDVMEKNKEQRRETKYEDKSGESSLSENCNEGGVKQLQKETRVKENSVRKIPSEDPSQNIESHTEQKSKSKSNESQTKASKTNKNSTNEKKKNRPETDGKKSDKNTKPDKSKKPEKTTTNAESEPKTTVPVKICRICKTEVLARNYDVHLLRCERLCREKEIKEEINKRQTEIKGVKKKEKKSRTEEGEDDFKIMEKYTKENNSCAFPRCRYRTIILLQLCPFCRNNFCLQHHQAEIHGCGEEARNHARTVLKKSVRNGVLTPGSIVPSKKPDPVKRGHLQRKLDKKLGEMEGQRKLKKKEK